MQKIIGVKVYIRFILIFLCCKYRLSLSLCISISFYAYLGLCLAYKYRLSYCIQFNSIKYRYTVFPFFQPFQHGIRVIDLKIIAFFFFPLFCLVPCIVVLQHLFNHPAFIQSPKHYSDCFVIFFFTQNFSLYHQIDQNPLMVPTTSISSPESPTRARLCAWRIHCFRYQLHTCSHMRIANQLCNRSVAQHSRLCRHPITSALHAWLPFMC